MSKEIEKAIKQFETSGLDKQFPEEYAKLLAMRDNDSTDLHKEAELVLTYITLPKPTDVRKIECGWCKLEFITNYAWQKYCSVDCLKAALLDRGLEWDPNKPMEERWKGTPPATIKPATLQVLLRWAEQVVSTSVDTLSSPRHRESSDLDRRIAELLG